MLARIRAHIALVSKSAFALGGFGGAVGLYGVYQLTTQSHHSGWFWLALCFGLLFVAQARAVQQAIKQAEEARVSSIQQVSQRLVEAKGSPQISISGSVQAMNLSSAPAQRRRRWHHVRLSATERKRLTDLGESLAGRILEFDGERRETTPQFSTWGREATQEEKREHFNREQAARDCHSTETLTLYHRRFVGELAIWLDQVEDVGFSPSEGLRAPRYLLLAGAFPLATIACEIQVLVARIKRSNPPWWRRLI